MDPETKKFDHCCLKGIQLIFSRNELAIQILCNLSILGLSCILIEKSNFPGG